MDPYGYYRPPVVFDSLELFTSGQDDDVASDLQAQVTQLARQLALYVPDLPALASEVYFASLRERDQRDAEKFKWLTEKADHLADLYAWRRARANDGSSEWSKRNIHLTLAAAEKAWRDVVAKLEEVAPERDEKDLQQLTPEMAVEILSRGFSPLRVHRGNAEYNIQRVALYAELMRHGKWAPSRIPIVLDGQGRAVDGRIRLFAVAESKILVPVHLDAIGA